MPSFLHTLRALKWRRVLPWFLAATVLLLPLISFANTAGQPGTPPEKPSLSLGGLLLDNTAGYLILGVAWLYQQIAMLLLAAGAYLLDLAIRVSLGIGDIAALTTGNLFLSEGVRVGWTVLRDIANIGFIFALIYIAIRTILNITDSGTLQKQVVSVIIGAMLINFSAFIALVVIDAGNSVAIVAYNQITRKGAPGPTQGDNSLISDAFLQHLNPQVLLAGKPETTNTNAALVAFLAGTLYLFAAYVLLEAAFVFIIRTVRLMFSIVVAPLMFAAYAIPGLEGNLKKWFTDLLGYSLVAPAYIFAILFILLLIKNLVKATVETEAVGLGALAASGGNSFSAVKTIFLFILILILMNRCLAFARSASAQISEVATSWAGTALGLAVGGIAGASRMTLGRAASKLATSDGLKNFAARSAFGAGILRTSKYAAGSSFDLRNAKPLQKGTKAIGADLGKAGGEGGYDKFLKTQVEAREKFAKDVLGKDTRAIKAKEEEIKNKEKEIEKNTDAIRDQRTKVDQARARKAAAEKAVSDIAAEKEAALAGGPIHPDLQADFNRRMEAAKSDLSAQTAALSAEEGAQKNLEQTADSLDKQKDKLEKEKKTVGNIRQEIYADRLDAKKGTQKGFNPGTWIIARKDKEAAEKIRKSFKEDKTKKLLDAFKEATGDEDKKDEGKAKKGGDKEAPPEGKKGEEKPH